MRYRFVTGALFALLASATASPAQDTPPTPPQNAVKLSAIVATVEQRDSFKYISNIEWNDDGYYEVTYFTTDKAKVEMNFDPVTGKPR